MIKSWSYRRNEESDFRKAVRRYIWRHVVRYQTQDSIKNPDFKDSIRRLSLKEGFFKKLISLQGGLWDTSFSKVDIDR